MLDSIKSKITLLIVAGCLLASQVAFSQGGDTKCKRTIDSTVVANTNFTVDYFRLYSPSMQREVKVLVATPPSYMKNPTKEFPVLYTLHGAGSPYDTWHHLLKLQDNINDKPFIYTCFDGDATSNYIDSYYPLTTSRDRSDTTKQKSLFKTFFFDEFMPAIDEWYRVDASRRAITGYSMGGQGALNYMLVAPEKFTAISSLSTTVLDFGDISGYGYSRMSRYLGEFETYPERYEALDELVRIKQYKEKNVALPPVYLHCGSDDRLLPTSKKLDNYLRELGYEVRFIESEGGHNWDFWLKVAGDVIDYHWKYFNK